MTNDTKALQPHLKHKQNETKALNPSVEHELNEIKALKLYFKHERHAIQNFRVLKVYVLLCTKWLFKMDMFLRPKSATTKTKGKCTRTDLFQRQRHMWNAKTKGLKPSVEQTENETKASKPYLKPQQIETKASTPMYDTS